MDEGDDIVLDFDIKSSQIKEEIMRMTINQFREHVKQLETDLTGSPDVKFEDIYSDLTLKKMNEKIWNYLFTIMTGFIQFDIDIDFSVIDKLYEELKDMDVSEIALLNDLNVYEFMFTLLLIFTYNSNMTGALPLFYKIERTSELMPDNPNLVIFHITSLLKIKPLWLEAKYPDISKMLDKIEWFKQNSLLGEMHLKYIDFFSLFTKYGSGLGEEDEEPEIYQKLMEITHSKIDFPNKSYDKCLYNLALCFDVVKRFSLKHIELIRQFLEVLETTIIEIFGSINKAKGSIMYYKRIGALIILCKMENKSNEDYLKLMNEYTNAYAEMNVKWDKMIEFESLQLYNINKRDSSLVSQSSINDLRKKLSLAHDILDNPNKACLFKYSILENIVSGCENYEFLTPTVDTALLDKIYDYLKDYKESYLQMICGYGMNLNNSKTIYIKQALIYAEELKLKPLNKQTLSLYITLAQNVGMNKNESEIDETMAKLKDMIEKVEELNSNEYLTYLSMLSFFYGTLVEHRKDMNLLYTLSLKHIRVQIKGGNSPKIIGETLKSVLMNFDHDKHNVEDVYAINDLVYDYLIEKHPNDKDTAFALQVLFSFNGIYANKMFVMNIIEKTSEMIIKHCGKVSLNYLSILESFADLLYKLQSQETYKFLLEAYDTAKALFGSETNIRSSRLLNQMAAFKLEIGQIEDAKNLLKKSEEIELILSSKESDNYKSTIQLKEFIAKLEKEIKEKKAIEKRKDTINFTKKLMTYGLVASTLVAAGVYIYKKYKSQHS